MLHFFNQIVIAVTGDPSRVCNPDPGKMNGLLCNPVGQLGGDLPTLVAQLMKDVGGVIGLLAIAAIVYAGFRMVMANGEKGQIDNAKSVLTYAIYGLVISIMAYAGVLAIENFIGVKNLPSASEPSSILPDYILGYPNLKEFVIAMIKNVLTVIGAVSLLMIIINGFRYVTSRGEPTQVESAKKGLTWALAGVALALLAFTLVSAIANLLG